MKILRARSYVLVTAFTAFFVLCTVCLVFVWYKLVAALISYGPSLGIPTNVTMLSWVCLLLAYIAAAKHPRVYIVPFIAIAFATVTLLSFNPFHASTSLSWDRFTFGWPFEWLEVIRRNSVEWISQEKKNVWSLHQNVQMVPLLGNLVVLTLFSVMPLVVWRHLIKGWQSRGEPD